MKAYRRILIISTALLLTGIFLFMKMSFSYRGSGVDTLMINDIISSVRESWDSMESFDGSRFDTEMIVFDSQDFIVYSSADEELEGVDSTKKATEKGCISLVVTADSRYLGTVVIPDPDRLEYERVNRRICMAAAVLSVMFLLAGIIYGRYVRRTIVKPFGEMEKFAENVASGKLDVPIRLEKNNMFGAFTGSFDIMREELKNARRREDELKIREKEMVASLSHDLKTPVTGIKLAAELLQMRFSVKAENADMDIVFSRDEINSMNDGVDGILQKSEQINALVSDLFTATLDDLGEFKVNCRDEDSGVLADIVKSCDDKHYAVMGELPQVIIHIDRKRMAQVIGNIISNSYKYADTTIDVDFKLSDGFLEMRIQDHGQGVPSDEIELITNKFYRGKAWADSGTDGNGLGLYIAKMLMKKMNGDLTAESDGGLAITLIIPLS